VQEAAATGADALAVARPFCTVMHDDGVKSSGRDICVVDLATLLAEAVDDGQPAPPSRSSS
jgi:Fe-S oxidoreductase